MCKEGRVSVERRKEGSVIKEGRKAGGTEAYVRMDSGMWGRKEGWQDGRKEGRKNMYRRKYAITSK